MSWFTRLFGAGGSPAKQGDTRVAELVAQLDDPDPRVREQAARALGDMGGAARGATEKLQELFTDDDGDVCNAAADAYSRIERGV